MKFYTKLLDRMKASFSAPPGSEKAIRRKLLLKFLQLSFEGGLTLLTLVMLLSSGSLGWFSNNKTVTASNMTFSVYNEDLNAEFYVYSYDERTDQATMTRSITDIRFQPHDIVFAQRNRYTPLVVRAKLLGSVLSDNDRIEIAIHRNGPGYSLQTLDEVSSSVLRFTGALGADLFDPDPRTLYFNMDRLLYERVLAYDGRQPSASLPAGNKVGESDVLTKQTGPKEFTKSGTISLSIPYGPDDVTQENGVPCLTVYLYITYDSPLVDIFRRQHMSLDIDQKDGLMNQIHTANDFSRVILSAYSSTGK